MIVRDYDSKNVLKDLIRVLERASSETCAFIEIRLEPKEINELLTELYKIPRKDIAEAPSIDIVKCAECKYRGTWKCMIRDMYVPREPKLDDFCSYGEREK